ncbi:hypothetical protein EC988_003934 [Linderina pennispora]|nr:hypothetical protein EC988_003934 [Linderina pennispora]
MHGSRFDEVAHNRDGNEDDNWRSWLAKISHMGLSDEGDLLPVEYFIKHPEVKPSQVAELGRFYAQYALDRYVAGWDSCLTVFRGIAPPCATATPESCWAADRSGPRGDPKDQCDDVRAMAQVASTSNGAQVRINRPPSPFPTVASVIASPAEMAVATPKPSASALPAGPVFTTQDPFYPCFEILANGRTVWNASPKFESVRMRTGIDGRQGGVHRFSARLLTGGLVQIGWCTEHCVFYPESGQGVGDDYESVAYDGSRCRKWFGIAEENEYGEAWDAGDVVCVELDLDLDRVVFYRNGHSMGVAFGVNEFGTMEGASCGFQGLPKDRIWYPAASLATAQGIEFLGMEATSVPPAPAQPPIGDALKAFRIKIEFEDLDSFPYITLALPGSHGQIIVAPVVDPRDLSTYLQPQWWALWVPPKDSIAGERADEPASRLSRWFAHQVTRAMAATADGEQCHGAVLGTSPDWTCFAVLRNGNVCVSAGEPQVVLDTGMQDDALSTMGHVWLPKVSSAIVRFELHTM